MKFPFNPSHHITGNYPNRELDPETNTDEMQEPCFAVSIPCGFETMDVAVYGHGLSESDAEDAADEHLKRLHWFSREPDKSAWIIRRIYRWQVCANFGVNGDGSRDIVKADFPVIYAESHADAVEYTRKNYPRSIAAIIPA